MITLLTGENSFEIDRALRQIVAGFDGRAEKIDGSELATMQLPDLFMGATLFADKRLVIIKSLSDNKVAWEAMSEWSQKVSDDIHLVLVEPKPDKRTRAYKELSKAATVKEYKLWNERDMAVAEKWAREEAKKQGWELDQRTACALVERIGVDQWALYHALEKLAVMDKVNSQVINEIIDAQPSENVFNLFEAALSGKSQQVSDMIRTLELSEDPYMVFGLLSGQAFQLAVLSVAEKSTNEIAKDIGAHPFALSKLSPHAKKLGHAKSKMVISIFAEADDGMKSSGGDPWLLVERALIKIAAI